MVIVLFDLPVSEREDGSALGRSNAGPQMNPGSVRTILNRLAPKISLPDHETRFSGYSFRVGAAIDLVETGAFVEKIMLRGGWPSNDSAMNYLRSW